LLPFDIDKVHVYVSKHFRNTWMRKWDWDQVDLREALREAHRVSRVGERKWEIFVRKKGHKKLVVVYDASSNEVFVITGSEG
jgi:hypothetical protein